MSGSTSTTCSVLFAMLDGPTDQFAWERFVNRYGPTILGWCRSSGLLQADAEDITQQVLIKFIEIADSFKPESVRFEGAIVM